MPKRFGIVLEQMIECGEVRAGGVGTSDGDGSGAIKRPRPASSGMRVGRMALTAGVCTMVAFGAFFAWYVSRSSETMVDSALPSAAKAAGSDSETSFQPFGSVSSASSSPRRVAPYREEAESDHSDASTPGRSRLEWLDAGPWGFEDLAAFWLEERHDPEWTSNMRSYVTALLENEELDLDLVHAVDCRQTLCRIEVNTSHMTTLTRIQHDARSANFRYAIGIEPVDAGESTVVLYSPRPELNERVFGAEAQAQGGGLGANRGP